MTLLHTAGLNGSNPFAYLLSLLRNPRALREAPSQWLPWNYQRTLALPVTA